MSEMLDECVNGKCDHDSFSRCYIAYGKHLESDLSRLREERDKLKAIAERFGECWLHTRQFKHAELGEICNLCLEFARVENDLNALSENGEGKKCD